MPCCYASAILLLLPLLAASQEAHSKNIGVGSYGQFQVAGYWQDALFPGLIRDGKVWESHIAAALNKLLTPGAVFIDGGANLGVHSLLASRLVGPSGEVHAFEAAWPNARVLRRSLRLNNMTNVIVHEAALGALHSTVCMPTPTVGPGGNRSTGRKQVHHMDYRVTMKTGTTLCGDSLSAVPLESLDALSDSMPRIDVIKVDIQGSELNMLKGAEAILRSRQPILIFELEEDRLVPLNASSAAVVEYVTSLGYDVYLLAEKYPSDHIAFPAGKLAKLREQLGEFTMRPLLEGSRINLNLEAGVNESLCMPTPSIPWLTPLDQTVECDMHPAYRRRRAPHRSTIPHALPRKTFHQAQRSWGS